MTSGKFISYIRVSTARQGASGLGIEAQRKSIADFINVGTWEMLSEFVEVESGKRNDRPQLNKALMHCRLTGATLVIARLDRLARNAHFLIGLQNAGVKFVAADMPDANEMTVGILAVIAQGEAQSISTRTKAALAAAKERGTRLGNPKNMDDAAAARGRILGLQARKSKSDKFYSEVYPLVKELADLGGSLRGIAKELNRRSFLTARGKIGNWSAVTVNNILKGPLNKDIR